MSAILSVAGAATAFYSGVGAASATVTFAGNGTASFISGVGQAALLASGSGGFTLTAISKSNAAVSIAGSGDSTLSMSATTKSSLVVNSLGIFAPVANAKSPSTASMQGSGAFNGSNLPGYDVTFSGSSTFTTVSYAFYLDADKAGPVYEARIAQALGENRTAVAPYEDRVYYTKSKPSSLGPPNRRRTL